MANQAETPIFSVIIPARNMSRFISETLVSLRDQSLRRFEALCVDDWSTDDTPRIIREFCRSDPRFRLLPGPGIGVSAARNLGLSEARGRYVLFLDADDLLAPDALARFAACLEVGSCPAALGGIRQISVTGAQLPGRSNLEIVPESGHLEALLKKNFIVNGGALAIRREAVDKAGVYDATLRNGEDWEFWCRLGLQGDFGLLDPEPVLFYRQVPTGANYRTRNGTFARTVPCIDRIAENPDFRERFGPMLPKLLRARRVDTFWSAVRNEYRYGSRLRALLIAFGGLAIYPDSFARPQLAMRFFASLRPS
ncbi:MAG: glycosyltransferase family 2 protein [Rhodobacteraceae bacterium]|nr:glycosyltransferase family 2 protein [Paracoccaceae bacterium]